MTRTVRIGTRESRLAVIQAELVANAIKAGNPKINTELVTMKTTGDKILNKTLDKIGGKGLFVKELDEALRRGEVDICVHSYKDMPADENPDMPVIAVSPRENPVDVLVLPKGARFVDMEKPIGCSSLRRQVQLKKLYPGQPVAPIRGNVLTRLNKLDSGEFSALVLAAAGMLRLGLWDRVSREFATGELLPAGCQGIMAVQGRAGEDYGYLDAYNDRDAWDESVAERAFIKELNCGCGAPVGVFCKAAGNKLWIRGMISQDGGMFYDEITGGREDARKLGAGLAAKMLKRADV